MVRTSERRDFRNCPQRWWWSWQDGLVAKGRPDGNLWFGTGVHLALAEWYQPGFERGPHPADTFAAWAGNEIEQIKAGPGPDDEAQYVDAKALGEDILTRYVDHYGWDDDLEILAIEQTFQVEIHRGGKPIGILAGTFDGVVIDHSGTKPQVWVLEHKTTANISTAFLSLDDQAGGYFSVADIVLHADGTLKPDQHIEGVLYNYLRKTPPDDRPRNAKGLYLNKDGAVSKKQPPPQFDRPVIERSPAEVSMQFKRLADEITVMNGMRDGSIPLLKNTTFMCPRCQFFDMCVLHERGDNRWTKFRDLAFTRQDRYADHRPKSAGE